MGLGGGIFDRVPLVVTVGPGRWVTLPQADALLERVGLALVVDVAHDVAVRELTAVPVTVSENPRLRVPPWHRVEVVDAVGVFEGSWDLV